MRRVPRRQVLQTEARPVRVEAEPDVDRRVAGRGGSRLGDDPHRAGKGERRPQRVGAPHGHRQVRGLRGVVRGVDTAHDTGGKAGEGTVRHHTGVPRPGGVPRRDQNPRGAVAAAGAQGETGPQGRVVQDVAGVETTGQQGPEGGHAAAHLHAGDAGKPGSYPPPGHRCGRRTGAEHRCVGDHRRRAGEVGRVRHQRIRAGEVLVPESGVSDGDEVALAAAGGRRGENGVAAGAGRAHDVVEGDPVGVEAPRRPPARLQQGQGWQRPHGRRHAEHVAGGRRAREVREVQVDVDAVAGPHHGHGVAAQQDVETFRQPRDPRRHPDSWQALRALPPAPSAAQARALARAHGHVQARQARVSWHPRAGAVAALVAASPAAASRGPQPGAGGVEGEVGHVPCVRVRHGALPPAPRAARALPPARGAQPAHAHRCLGRRRRPAHVRPHVQRFLPRGQDVAVGVRLLHAHGETQRSREAVGVGVALTEDEVHVGIRTGGGTEPDTDLRLGREPAGGVVRVYAHTHPRLGLGDAAVLQAHGDPERSLVVVEHLRVRTRKAPGDDVHPHERRPPGPVEDPLQALGRDPEVVPQHLAEAGRHPGEDAHPPAELDVVGAVAVDVHPFPGVELGEGEVQDGLEAPAPPVDPAQHRLPFPVNPLTGRALAVERHHDPGTAARRHGVDPGDGVTERVQRRIRLDLSAGAPPRGQRPQRHARQDGRSGPASPSASR